MPKMRSQLPANPLRLYRHCRNETAQQVADRYGCNVSGLLKIEVRPSLLSLSLAHHAKLAAAYGVDPLEHVRTILEAEERAAAEKTAKAK
jgi:transcriptional regulator with XRE-family HTH domain